MLVEITKDFYVEASLIEFIAFNPELAEEEAGVERAPEPGRWRLCLSIRGVERWFEPVLDVNSDEEASDKLARLVRYINSCKRVRND